MISSSSMTRCFCFSHLAFSTQYLLWTWGSNPLLSNLPRVYMHLLVPYVRLSRLALAARVSCAIIAAMETSFLLQEKRICKGHYNRNKYKEKHPVKMPQKAAGKKYREYQGSTKLVSVVSRIPDKLLMVRQMTLKITTKKLGANP